MAFINKLNVGVTIKVVDASGKKDSINIQPKGRAALPEGYSIDPDYVKEYASILIDTEAVKASPIETKGTISLATQ